MNDKKWNDFKKAIKQAREDSSTSYGFDTWKTVRVNDENRVFDLNPFSVDLKTGVCHAARDLASNKINYNIDLRECIDCMFGD